LTVGWLLQQQQQLSALEMRHTCVNESTNHVRFAVFVNDLCMQLLALLRSAAATGCCESRAARLTATCY